MADSMTRPRQGRDRVSTLQSPALDGGAEKLGLRAWSLLFVLCGAIFLEGLDVSMMGVALPSIRSDLGMSTSSLQWVVSAYVVGYGGFVLLGGRAADLLGRRRMFSSWPGSVRTIGSLLATGALLTAFVAIEGRSAAPLVRVGILRSGPLVRSNLGAMCLAGAFFGFQFIAVLYMQQLRAALLVPVVAAAIGVGATALGLLRRAMP